MKKFDVSWKFIVLIIVMAMFLLSALDLVVHGATTTNDRIPYWDKIQMIEDRAIKVFKEEGDDNVPESIDIWEVIRENPDECTYKYIMYYADGETESDTITLEDSYVDAAYILYNYIEDDTRWINAMTILEENYYE